MAATVSAYNDALKQVWTQDRLEEQLYDGNPLLDELEKTSRFHTGKEAVTPLHKSRNGGYSAKPASGGTLNSAGNQGIDQAVWNYTHHYQQIEIESAAVDQTDGKPLSVANVIETEVTGALSDLRKQLTRQAFGNGDALIAKCATSTSTTTINLDPNDYGYDAIERGWLHAGLPIDIGTTASEASVADGVTIESVKEDAADPEIVISGSNVTTSSSHYVSIKDARSGTTSYESNGLRNIVGSGTLGGIDPSTAGNEWWKSDVDATAQALSLPLMYERNRKVMQKTGKPADYVVTSLKQQEAFYKLLQMQARFNGDNALGAGNVGAASFAGMTVHAHPDCPNRCMFFLSKKHLFIVAVDKPYWQNKLTGGDILEWKQGNTAFTAVLIYRLNLATNRRNAHSALTNLS
jgi:hypothetical protein